MTPGRWRTLLVEHRRLLAAACAFLAVLLLVAALRRPGDVQVVPVAAADLASGQVIGPGDVGTAAIPRSAVPDRALDADELVGRRVGGAMRSGEVFTDARVLATGPADGLATGTVISTLRLADGTSAQGLRVGDRVDVLAVATDQEDGPRAHVVAEAAAVAALPSPDESGASTVALVVPRETALELARAALEAPLGVVATGQP